MVCTGHAAEPTHVVIRASAGTGKTFQLTNRFLRLLLTGVAPDRVLATTFTRKAAGEIQDRVIVRLAEAATSAEQRERLAAAIGSGPLSEEHCLSTLHRLLRHLHRLRIGTLDSYFGHLARAFAPEIGLPPAWRVVDPVEETELRDAALQRVLAHEQTADLVSLAQLLTKGEASRGVSELLRGTVKSLHELYLDACAEAWLQIPRLQPLDGSALHAARDRLRELSGLGKALDRGRTEDLERAEQGGWECFIATGIAAKLLAGETTYRGAVIPDDVREAYRPLLAHARAVILDRIARQMRGACELLRKYDGELRQLRAEQRLLRFSDVTREVADYLSELARGTSERPLIPAPAAGVFDYRLDGRIEHLLLDEFQDTAPVQWRVLRPLAEQVTRGAAQGSLFCVGDVKQAIYGWRGGVAELFDEVQNQLPGLHTEQLNASYRSAPPIIETVNRVFQSVASHSNLERAQPAVAVWQRQFPAHTTERRDRQGLVVLETAASAGGSASAVDLAFAAERITALVQRRPARSCGVLVRRNETVAELIAALKRRGTAASEEGGNPLTDAPPVQLLLSLVRLADHPADAVSRFHLAHSPLGTRLGWDDAGDPAAFRLAQRIRRELGEEGYGAVVARWAGWLQRHCSRAERARLEQLVELAYSYQPRATLRCVDFVRFVERQRVADPASAAVRVMTIHQAKGLEFDIVVLPELEVPLIGQPDLFVAGRSDPAGTVDSLCRYVNQDIQRLLPPSFQQMFAAATHRVVTESLCLLYVAMTRAVHELRMLIRPSTPREGVLPQTYAGLLRATLSDGQPVTPGRTLYEHGDPQWYAVIARDRESAPAATARPAPEPARLFAPQASKRRRGLQRTAPSTSEGGSRTRLHEVLRPDREPALLRGSLLHTWCEAIGWLDDGWPDRELLYAAGQATLREANLPAADLDAGLTEFGELLKQPQIEQVFRRSSYCGSQAGHAPRGKPAPVRRVHADRELPFAIRRGDELVSGRIDRLVRIYDDGQLVAAEILDFKSDKLPQGDVAGWQERVQFYRPQLEAYRHAAAELLKLAPQNVSARLVFLQLGCVITV